LGTTVGCVPRPATGPLPKTDPLLQCTYFLPSVKNAKTAAAQPLPCTRQIARYCMCVKRQDGCGSAAALHTTNRKVHAWTHALHRCNRDTGAGKAAKIKGLSSTSGMAGHTSAEPGRIRRCSVCLRLEPWANRLSLEEYSFQDGIKSLANGRQRTSSRIT